MAEDSYTTLLEEALEAWQDVRLGVLREAEAVPDDEYEFRPHPEARTVSQLLVHILESAEMMAGELTRPDGDFRRQSFGDHVREHAASLPDDPAPEQLRALLEARLEEGVARFREAGELWTLQLIRRFDGKRGTRLAWMHHGISHEMYHRGQLATYVRAMGRVPALTRRIRGG